MPSVHHRSPSLKVNQTMATGGTTEVLQEISERYLQCSICLNCFTEPKALNCLHSFCLECLKYLIENPDTETAKITCPLCRRETTLGRNEVEDLSTNFTLSALVEEFAMHEQLQQGQGSEIKCQSCDDTNQATSFCMNCAHFLCKDCQKVHERLPVTKSHQTYTLSQLQSGEIAYKSKLREEPKCEQHPDQNINIYCNTCQQLVCTTCFVLKHQKHSCSDISHAFKKCNQKIAELMAKAEDKREELNNAKTNIAESRKKLDNLFDETNKKISQKADKEVARIREMEQKLKQEAQEIYQDRVKTLTTADDINNTQLRVVELELAEINNLQAEEIKTEILKLKPKLLHNLQEITRRERPQTVPENLHSFDFHESNETVKSLGRLILKDKFKLERQMKRDETQITSVAVFSDNEIVTVESKLGYLKCKQLVSYLPTNNSTSSFISKMLQIQDIANPIKIAVNRLDHLIVLDGSPVNMVKTFSREYQLLHRFQLAVESISYIPVGPTCLAVDDDNLIAVGYMAKGEISLHNPDGTLIRRLPAPMTEDQLVMSNKQIIYWSTDHSTCILVSTDYHGNTVFEVDNSNPRSVCCDMQGNIYMYISSDYKKSTWQGRLLRWGRRNIHQYNAEGKYTRGIIKEDMDVTAMTCTTRGDLLLGGTSLKLYCRV
ncbi:E3 ubiquitin-protein ligase TRIM33-like isoform X1 [Acanthaster planci]|uniref:E3 ubiquitin-protein ligase TRIM33-like isoform X1 n=1 Tax=Acanthaster planci TaxID=133434 RepID=A0A8B7Y1I2_ACAPL|nr:E3 ubiquitin-protein ligase TRIM33-like isoform X1 [Acanthaster planci]